MEMKLRRTQEAVERNLGKRIAMGVEASKYK
jgi:hypothetical protein